MDGEPRVETNCFTVDSQQPLRDIRPMSAYLEDGIAPARFQTTMLGAASFIALILASVGLFSVMAVSVTERRYEIGIRMALGAARGSVLRLVMKRAMTLAGAGIGGGLVLALGLARGLESLLFEISPLDGATYAAAALGLLCVAALAAYIPAQRASGFDPVSTLRGD